MINDVIGFSEIDAKATATYKANYDTANEIEMGDIVAFIKDKARFDNIPHFNLLTGGFPCQTFSMMGNQAGFNEDRGQMFFRIMDIVHTYHPNFILLENVKNLMNHDNKRTYRRIKKEL
jgi:DNA (cytosine-5)-methyltransferase 1